ncbi:rho guanine nucleotide exchange factor 37 isoform X2 [Engystomops pustulosus]|uniref:rho guanine nucleotide exchange factor 37 isoform X2 n=1 Tax=Engystomops pustulosus TaxID=76066 RepID=UPI003AFA0C28
MATNRRVHIQKEHVRRRSEDVLSTSHNQNYRIEGNLKYRCHELSGNDILTGTNAYNDRLSHTNWKNRGKSERQLKTIFSPSSNSSHRPPVYPGSSQSSVPPSCIQKLPEQEIAYNDISKYKTSPFPKQQYDYCKGVSDSAIAETRGYLHIGSSVYSLSSKPRVKSCFDDFPIYIEVLPDKESAYKKDNDHRKSQYGEELYDDCISVKNTVTSRHLHTGSSDSMDNPDLQNVAHSSSCMEETHPIESKIVYENVPNEEDNVYHEVEGFGINAHPAVVELISTEESYVKSLQLLTSSIQPSLKKFPDIDVKSLFSNLEEITMVHELFLRELKQTERDPENQLVRIGSLFQEFSKDMENVYSLYCSTYTRSTSLLQHYQEMHVGELIQDAVKSASERASSQFTDLSFYLVMPVQRITKYPLLIQNILSIGSQDKGLQDALQRALSTMKEVNANINENKRRKEVASKYLRLDQQTLFEKMSKLSTHTLSKKSQRLSLFLKQQTGIIPKKEDKDFDILVERFHRLAAVVGQMEENVISYVKNVEEYFLIQPETYPLEYLQGSVHPINGYTLQLCSSIYPAFKKKLQIMVLQPLINLSEYLKGPKNLIRKRLVKLLDYENLEEKYSETGKMTWEEEDIVNNYKTIHSMLQSELPSCISLSYELLNNIFYSFIAVHKDLAAQAHINAEEHSAQIQCSELPEPQFRKWVEDCMCHSVSQLNEFTKKFDEQLPVPVPQEHIPVIERQIQQLLKRHSPQKLYQVISAVKGTRDMELTLSRGDVVAVIQYADTKGNKNRWLVDTGGLRGYVPCNKLQQYQESHSPRHSQSPTQSQSSPEARKTETRRHTVASPVCPYPTFSQPQDTAYQVIAGYSFEGRSQYEATITAGEPVIVLEPHDKNGSPEWSLVEVRGQRGYVPSSYLLTIPVYRPSRKTS